MPARYVCQLLARLAVPCVAALAGACYYMPPTVVPIQPDPAPATFMGIDQMPADAKTQRIRILFIHGMGVNGPCDADTLLYHLSQAMRVTPVDPPPAQIVQTCPHFALRQPEGIPAPNAHDEAELYSFELEGGGRQVTFMYLLWSPLTDVPKNDVDETGHPHRALTSNLVKDFMKSHLADVILYGGTYRDVLRPALEYALCRFVGGTPEADRRLCDNGDPTIPTAIITHSLGGYMLMDTISDLAYPTSGHRLASTRSVAYQVALHLDQIFMLANQVSMLDLTTRTSEEATATEATPPLARRFHDAWDSIQANRVRTPHEVVARQVLAISDPNDILSWELTKSGWGMTDVTQPVVVANVYVGTTAEVPGLFRWPFLGLSAYPVAAHVNYLQDNAVMDIIACGMTGASINTCPQPAP